MDPLLNELSKAPLWQKSIVFYIIQTSVKISDQTSNENDIKIFGHEHIKINHPN